MPSAIISDASCLILLDKIDALQVLQSVYGSIVTIHEVASEFGRDLPSWIQIADPADKEHLKTIEQTLDKGEASAIALALEFEDCLLIIDELKGRKYALQQACISPALWVC